jgi:hypothetical protein
MPFSVSLLLISLLVLPSEKSFANPNKSSSLPPPDKLSICWKVNSSSSLSSSSDFLSFLSSFSKSLLEIE